MSWLNNPVNVSHSSLFVFEGKSLWGRRRLLCTSFCVWLAEIICFCPPMVEKHPSGIGAIRTSSISYRIFPTSTEQGYKMVPRLRECFVQSQAEVVSKSTNKIHQTWGPPFDQALYRLCMPANSRLEAPYDTISAWDASLYWCFDWGVAERSAS